MPNTPFDRELEYVVTLRDGTRCQVKRSTQGKWWILYVPRPGEEGVFDEQPFADRPDLENRFGNLESVEEA